MQPALGRRAADSKMERYRITAGRKDLAGSHSHRKASVAFGVHAKLSPPSRYHQESVERSSSACPPSVVPDPGPLPACQPGSSEACRPPRGPWHLAGFHFTRCSLAEQTQGGRRFSKGSPRAAQACSCTLWVRSTARAGPSKTFLHLESMQGCPGQSAQGPRGKATHSPSAPSALGRGGSGVMTASE